MSAEGAEIGVGIVRTRAFTLVETLAAAALLGLVASVVALGLAGAGDKARLGEAVTMVRDLDQRARELARSGGPVALGLDGELRRMTITGVERRGSILAERWLPSAVDVTLREPGGSAVNSITFDRLGRSRDYTVQLAASGNDLVLSVSGLTGWMEESR